MDYTNIIDFAEAKDKAALDAFDVDAALAELGLDRARVEADFASLGVNEDAVPDLSYWKTSLEAVLETRPALLDHRIINESFKMERLARNGIIIAKMHYLIRLASGEDVGGPGSPSASGKAADRETGGLWRERNGPPAC
jgi:hypothetical protein